MSERTEAAQILANQSDLSLSVAQIQRLLQFGDLVMEGNRRLNLTGQLDWPTFVYKHLLDSLSILPFVADLQGKVLDVGTGAGFPGIPLAIVRPNWQLTLLDSLHKRVEFLETACEQLKLVVELIWSRAEDFGQKPESRERYELVTSRAVAKLPVLVELCLPLVSQGGLMIAYKGPEVQAELAEADYALELLGGELLATPKLALPGDYGIRHLVVIRKRRPTPASYPRRAGVPGKKPLLARQEPAKKKRT